MVTVGGDSHKLANTVVAVDENGRQLGETTVAATPTGHMEAFSVGAHQMARAAMGFPDQTGISDEVYRRLRQDHSERSTALAAVAA